MFYSESVFYIFLVQFTLWTSYGVSSLNLPPTVRRPPRITEQSPEIYNALPKIQIELECTADSLPKVKENSGYYWKKDGKLLNVSEVEEDWNQSTLQIVMSNVDGTIYFNGSEKLKSDALMPYEGKYQCFASNKWGTAISSEIDLKVGTIASYNGIVDEILVVNEGESKQVLCRKNVTKDIEIKWIFVPSNVQLSNRIAQASDGTIVFSNVVAEEDQGLQFWCIIKHKSTRTSTDGTHYVLSVKTDNPENDRKPTIVRPRKDEEKIVALRGETLKLICIATGKLTPSVYWTRKNTRRDDVIGIDEQDRYELVDYNRTLYINTVEYGDAGEYTCTATNDLGWKKKDFEVIVQAKPYFSSDEKQPIDIVKVPGDSVEFRCHPEGDPMPEVVWLRNGIPIDDEPRGVVFADRIVLKYLTESDTAVYQCIGKNIHGTVIGQGFLNVLTSPPVPLPSNKMLYRKMEGHAVDLKCGMFAAPNHYTNWTKFGQAQKNLLWDGRITLKKSNTLKIEHINSDDSGIYECEGINEFGSATINITLLVLDRTSVRPTGNKERYFVTRGNDVSMSVEVFTHGNLSWYTVKWYKDGYNMGEGIELPLLSVSFGDEGEYTILVETEFDQAETALELIVQDAPKEPINVMFTVDINDTYAGTLNWEAPVSDNNSPVISYKVEYEAAELYPGKWDMLASTRDGIETSAEVTNLEPWVDYSFRVWAQNLIGVSEYPSEATEPHKTSAKEPRHNPKNVVGKGTSPDNMVISWDPVNPMKYAGPGFGYDISWCIESDCTWNIGPFDSIASYTVTGTPPHTRYLINVTSSNDIGKAKTSMIVVGYSGDDVPLEAPSGFTREIRNDSSVTVSWKPVPEEKMRGLVTGYRIKAKEKDTGKLINKTVEPNDLSTELELEPFTEYEITVTAENSAGESAPSTVLRIKTPEGLPDSPEGLMVTKRKLKDLEFEWIAPTKVKGVILSYRLKYDWMQGDETKAETETTTKRKCRLTHLEPSTIYNVTVCAQTSRGFGDMCARLSTSTQTPRKPRKPRYNVIMDYELANITWETSEEDQNEGIPITSFLVQHMPVNKEKSKDWISTDKIYAASDNWFYSTTIRNLVSGTEYAFRIISHNEYGQSTSNSTVKKTPGAIYQSGSGIVGQPWFIVVLCVAALIIFVVVIICFMRRRKGGKYSVSEKEEQLVKLESQPMNNDASGKYSLNPTKDLKDENGTTTPVDDPLAARRPRGDSVGGNSIEVFGSGDTRDFEEDGSFIDQYGIDRRSHGKSGVSSPTSDDSKDLSNAQTRLIPDDAV